MTERSAKVVSECYCSSSFDHFMDVRWVTARGRRYERTYWVDGDELLGEDGFPIAPPSCVVMRLIRQAVIDEIESGEMRVYEYDRDHNKRYGDLRYHDEEWNGRIVQRLKEWNQG